MFFRFVCETVKELVVRVGSYEEHRKSLDPNPPSYSNTETGAKCEKLTEKLDSLLNTLQVEQEEFYKADEKDSQVRNCKYWYISAHSFEHFRDKMSEK